MITDDEKYQRLIRYSKMMITLVSVICVIITGYVFIQMKAVIIPLVLALIIYFLLNPALIYSDKKKIHEIITILVIIWIAEYIKIILENIYELEPLSVLMRDYKGRYEMPDSRYLIPDLGSGIRNPGSL